VISRIIKVELGVISRSQRLSQITFTETLIILDITKTEVNNLLVFSVTQFKIDQNKNQNRSIDKV